MFAVTVLGPFTFHRFGGQNLGRWWFLVNTVLALQLAVPHSLLLLSSTRKRLKS